MATTDTTEDETLFGTCEEDVERQELVEARPATPPQKSDPAPFPPTFRPPVWPLYVSHLFSTFGDRMWQFAVPVLFTELNRESPHLLLPSALFSFGLYAATFLGMVYVGTWVDRTPRLKVLRTCIVCEAAAIVCSAFFFWVVLQSMPSDNSMRLTSSAVPGFICLLATSIIAELMARGGTMALEKDWVVVIADGDSAYQTHLNTVMRRIDLLCKLLGPFFFGILVQTLGSSPKHKVQVGVLVMALWNVLCVPLEWVTADKVYSTFPKLGVKADRRPGGAVSPIDDLRLGFGKYLRHPIVLASLAYCQLWMTVLDNGTLMTSYLKDIGVPAGLLGASRGFGAILGIIGTFIFPFALRRCDGSLEKLGVISLWGFLAVLLPVGFAFAFDNMALSSGILMLVLVVLSRVLLWCFDLVIQQLMQERIEEESRGAVNGVHGSMCQLALMLISVMGMGFSAAEDFVCLVLISLMSVMLACILFTAWAHRQQYINH